MSMSYKDKADFVIDEYRQAQSDIKCAIVTVAISIAGGMLGCAIMLWLVSN